MEFTSYIILGLVFSSFLFIGAALVLYWAYRNGQLNNLEAGARTIFDDEEEPIGTQTDHFPNRNRKEHAANRS